MADDYSEACYHPSHLYDLDRLGVENARLREQVRGLTEAGEVVLTVHDVVGDDAEGAFEEALAELRAAVNRRSEGD